MMKGKKIVFMILFYTVCFAVGGVIGLGLNSGAFTLPELIVGCFVGYNISIIVHEAGHLVCGLISGYGFSSFRIWSFMLMRVDGRFSFHRHKLAGTAGQCLMTPPKGDDREAPVILYNLGGVIFNFLLSALCLGLYAAFPEIYMLSNILVITAVISFVTILGNGIPLALNGIANDGLNALFLSKDKAAKVAFLNQLRMNEAQTRGVRLCEMPDEWFEVPEGVDKKNVAFSSIAVFKVNREFDKLDSLKSEKQIEELLASEWNIIGLHKNLLLCDLAFCRLINYGKDADVSILNTQEMQNFRKSMKNYMSVIRTEYALALLHSSDDKASEKWLSAFEKAAKNSPYPADVNSERELISLAQSCKNTL